MKLFSDEDKFIFILCFIQPVLRIRSHFLRSRIRGFGFESSDPDTTWTILCTEKVDSQGSVYGL